MTAPPQPPDEFPVRGVRFAGGRTGHRTRRPDGDQHRTVKVCPIDG